MEYRQRESLINGLREAMGVNLNQQHESDSMYDAGTGTLYLLGKRITNSDIDEAINYFEKKIERKSRLLTPQKEREKYFCELAISCIQSQFGMITNDNYKIREE